MTTRGEVQLVAGALGRAYEAAARRLPPDLAGRLDLFRPRVGQAWGGPLNGQVRRRDIVRAVARTVPVDLVVETGTFRGTSTEFFSSVFGVPVVTVEADPRFHAYSSRRLAFDPAIRVVQGDSRPFLRQLTRERPDDTVFAYLDAHWEQDLPLREELEVIRDGWSSAVVLVDDFAVPGDPGYGYDDYGPGRALVPEYLPEMPGWTRARPAASSAEETGARRGCCVLLSPAFATLDLRGLGLAPMRGSGP